VTTNALLAAVLDSALRHAALRASRLRLSDLGDSPRNRAFRAFQLNDTLKRQTQRARIAPQRV
jgi:hypothetical protein